MLWHVTTPACWWEEGNEAYQAGRQKQVSVKRMRGRRRGKMRTTLHPGPSVRGEEEARLAAEESKGIIGGQASRGGGGGGGGWDLITTIITIICLGLIALSDPCANWIA